MNPLLLLVDDNEEILEFLEHELNEKYTILKAVDGQQALDLLKENAVHLVISDVMMPVIDGFELCRLIKSNFEFSHIPVILLTARIRYSQRLRVLSWGQTPILKNHFLRNTSRFRLPTFSLTEIRSRNISPVHHWYI